MTHKKTFIPSDEEIARYAYHLWEAEGRIHGRDLDYWLQAQAHLKAHREYEAKLLETKNVAAPDPAVLTEPRSKPTRQRRATRPARERAYA